MARPRKSLPSAADVQALLEAGHPWKVIEVKTGVSRRTILRRVLPTFSRVLPRSRDCSGESAGANLVASPA